MPNESAETAALTAAELRAYQQGADDMRVALLSASVASPSVEDLRIKITRLPTPSPAPPPALILPQAPAKAVLNGEMGIEGQYVCFEVTRNDGTKDRFLFTPKSAARTADGLVQMALALDPKALQYLGGDVEALLDRLTSKPKPN